MPSHTSTGIICLLKSTRVGKWSSRVWIFPYTSVYTRPLSDCKDTTGCKVIRIGTKLGSFSYRISLCLIVKFHNCICLLSWRAIFNIPACITAGNHTIITSQRTQTSHMATPQFHSSKQLNLDVFQYLFFHIIETHNLYWFTKIYIYQYTKP